MSEEKSGKYQVMTKEEFLATRPFYWTYFYRSAHDADGWKWEKTFATVKRSLKGNEGKLYSVPETDRYENLNEALNAARSEQVEWIDGYIWRLQEEVKSLGMMGKIMAIFSHQVKRYLKKRKAMLAAAARLRESFTSVKSDVQIRDLKEQISLASKLAVGTKLWLVSLKDEPEITQVSISASEEVYLSIYQGKSGKCDVDYNHSIAFPASGDSLACRVEHNQCFNLQQGPLPDELPWATKGERLFTSREAAQQSLLLLADKCRAVASSVT